MGKADLDVLEARIAEGERNERTKKMKAFNKKMKKKRKGFFSDFKKFITKGNVVDLAVAVILGAAFNAIVNGLVKMIINPLIAVFTDGISLDEVKQEVVAPIYDEAGELVSEGVYILWGQWIQTILDFFIIAMTIFIIARVAHRATTILKHKELEAKKAADAAKKEADEAAAAAAAEKAAAEKAALEQMYANIARQTELLEKLANK